MIPKGDTLSVSVTVAPGRRKPALPNVNFQDTFQYGTSIDFFGNWNGVVQEDATQFPNAWRATNATGPQTMQRLTTPGDRVYLLENVLDTPNLNFSRPFTMEWDVKISTAQKNLYQGLTMGFDAQVNGRNCSIFLEPNGVTGNYKAFINTTDAFSGNNTTFAEDVVHTFQLVANFPNNIITLNIDGTMIVSVPATGINLMTGQGVFISVQYEDTTPNIPANALTISRFKITGFHT